MLLWVRVTSNAIWWSCCYAKCFIRSISKELWCYYNQLLHNNIHQLCWCTLCPLVRCQCVSVRNSTQQNHIILFLFFQKKVQMFRGNPEVSLSGNSWPPSSGKYRAVFLVITAVFISSWAKNCKFDIALQQHHHFSINIRTIKLEVE